MKVIASLSALVLFAASALAQGQISFQNSVLPAQQIRLAADGSLMPVNDGAANSLTFFILWGTTSANLNNSTLGTPIFNSATRPGRLAGDVTFALTGSTAGTQVYLQMFGFSTAAGSYAAAEVSPVAGQYLYGCSPIIQTLMLTASPAPGTVIFGNNNTANYLAGFSLYTSMLGVDTLAVPEAGTLALMSFGAGILLLLRPHKWK